MKSEGFYLILLGIVCIICLVIAGCCSTTETTTAPISDSNSNGITTTKAISTKPTIVTTSMNRALVVKTYSGTFEITALDYKRGAEANQLMLAANMFNTKPDAGYEYLLINVREKYASGDSSASVSKYEFQVYANNVGHSAEFGVMPTSLKDFESVSLLSGGQVEGWIAFIVPEGANAKLSYEYLGEPKGFITIP